MGSGGLGPGGLLAGSLPGVPPCPQPMGVFQFSEEMWEQSLSPYKGAWARPQKGGQLPTPPCQGWAPADTWARSWPEGGLEPALLSAQGAVSLGWEVWGWQSARLPGTRSRQEEAPGAPAFASLWGSTPCAMRMGCPHSLGCVPGLPGPTARHAWAPHGWPETLRGAPSLEAVTPHHTHTFFADRLLQCVELGVPGVGAGPPSCRWTCLGPAFLSVPPS